MNCSSVPKSLLFALFGGAVLWFGSSCRQATASDIEQTPAKVEAPDTLAAPDDATAMSSISATPIDEDGEAVSHWDDGPTYDDQTPCEDSDSAQDASLSGMEDYQDGCDYTWEDEYTDGDDDAADAEDAMVVEGAQDEEQADAYPDEGCNYDEYDYDYDYDYSYGNESVDGDDDTADAEDAMVVEDAQDEEQADAYADEDDYSYGDAYDYSDGGDDVCDDDASAADVEEVTIVEDLPEEQQADAYAVDESDDYDYAWEEPVTETQDNIAVGTDDFSYEFDEYETYYGYEFNALNAMEEEAAVDEVEEPAATDEAGPCTGEEEWETYAYEDEGNDDYDYDYADPAEYYGHDYEEIDWAPLEAGQPTDAPHAALDLFARQPAELLAESDWALMRTLESLYREPNAVRRAKLNDYLESLGFEAIDFAYRFEDASDGDVLELADDLASVAALLACYRLVERGEIGMDEAVELLQQSLSRLTLDWIEAVGQTTAGSDARSQADAAPHPVVEAMVSVTNRSIGAVKALASAVAAELAEMPWRQLTRRLDEVRSAARPTTAAPSLSL